MAVVRKAKVTWEGDLLTGKGNLSTATSAAFSGLPVTWGSRTEAADGRTSPEELIAAAHASCFSMALSAGLGKTGTPPTRLDVEATVTFDKGDSGWRILSSFLRVVGTVPGIDSEKFSEAANAAKDGCPVSQAIKGNVDLNVDAILEVV